MALIGARAGELLVRHTSMLTRLRIKFSLRFLLVLTAFSALLIGVWLRPYSLKGYYPNGNVAWEQAERRTLKMDVFVISRTTWYPSGELTGRWTRNGNSYYSPAGEEFSGLDRNRIREWGRTYSHLLPSEEMNEHDKRPLKWLLLSFNPHVAKLKLSI